MIRFRGDIYVDIFVKDEGTLEEQREKAYSILKEYTNNIQNAFTDKSTLKTKAEMLIKMKAGMWLNIGK